MCRQVSRNDAPLTGIRPSEIGALAGLFLLLLVPQPASGQLRVVDHWPNLLAHLGQFSDPQSFTQFMRQQFPETADRIELAGMDGQALQSYQTELQKRAASIEAIERRIWRVKDAVASRFENLLPDFNPATVTIYLTVSRFRFDGKIPHEQPNSLLLGLDGLVKFHGENAPVEVILSHELFHIYHWRVNPPLADVERLPLYRQVWQEGLAIYVSGLLNSTASLADLLLDPRLASEGDHWIKPVSRDLLINLEATDESTAAIYLSYRTGGLIPPRMGYLVGYEMVRSLARQRSLSDLIHMRDPELRFTCRRELRKLAFGPQE